MVTGASEKFAANFTRLLCCFLAGLSMASLLGSASGQGCADGTSAASGAGGMWYPFPVTSEGPIVFSTSSVEVILSRRKKETNV